MRSANCEPVPISRWQRDGSGGDCFVAAPRSRHDGSRRTASRSVRRRTLRHACDGAQTAVVLPATLPCERTMQDDPSVSDPCPYPPNSFSWSHCSPWVGARMPTLPSARFARSPSIHPTKRRCFGSVCRKISISLSNWWSEVVPIGWPPPAGRAFTVMCSSSPAISTGTPSSIRIRWPPASFCRSPRWNAPLAVSPVPDCSRN